MTRYLCDTNSLIASACGWHEHHARTHTEFQRRGVRGGQMYDALIAAAAFKAGASAILTWNRRNFEPFAGDIQIESPP